MPPAYRPDPSGLKQLKFDQMTSHFLQASLLQQRWGAQYHTAGQNQHPFRYDLLVQCSNISFSSGTGEPDRDDKLSSPPACCACHAQVTAASLRHTRTLPPVLWLTFTQPVKSSLSAPFCPSPHRRRLCSTTSTVFNPLNNFSMPSVLPNASYRHASNPGTIFAPTAGQTQVSDEPTTPTTKHIQDNDSSADLTSVQDDTDNPATVPSIGQHEDGGDETMEAPLLVEPDQRAFQPIFTGRLVWSATHSNAPIVPFEELPTPKSNCARVPPCTVRWQFTRNFNLNREEDIARGSCQRSRA
ncbi:uncharacterized protein UDID_18392 [Ustilago sp. UG-2017a]|nr:uncharacterized protein UDID_18392 [Ustilago sp. UG-2017a]